METIILQAYYDEGLTISEIAAAYHLEPDYVYHVVFKK